MLGYPLGQQINGYNKQEEKNMKLTGNTILITGGGSGIGLAFSERFLETGNRVIICGRREDVLDGVKKRNPGLITYKCDLTIESDRIALFDWVTSNYPEINVLINNAGISQRFNILTADAKATGNISTMRLYQFRSTRSPFHAVFAVFCKEG